MDIGKNVRLGNISEFGQCLSFYDVPPTETISLQAFEEYAADRLKSNKDVHYIHLNSQLMINQLT